MKGKIISIVLILAAFLLTRCANVVAPTGGAKDITPPKVVEANPANHSIGFNGNKIELTFDEFVALNNASQQVLVSPPLATKPDIKLSGKTVAVKFKEDLRPNTTYTIYFGEAIKDFHEGNLFKDYQYSFSTGNLLDTLVLKGKVLNADDKKPAADLYVSLYHGDSTSFQPLRRAPDFITKTDKEGAFIFHGLPDQQFLVFALQDMNSNFYYDLPNEKVAFLDTMVSPMDSVSLTLYAFTEIDTTQMLLESKLVEEGLLRFVFRHPAENVCVTTPDQLPEPFKMIEIWSKQHDTLCWYFTPEVMDSLRVEVRSEMDTLINKDFHFNLHFKGGASRNKKNARVLKVSNNLKNNLLPPGEELLLRFGEPIVEIRDTLLHYIPTDAYGMEYRIDTTICDTVNYAFTIADSTFYSIRGRVNNAISLRMKRAKDSDFGAIIIAVSQLLELELSAGSIPIPSSRSLLLSSLSMSESLTGIRSSGFSSPPIAPIGSCMYNASNPLGSCICILLSEFTLNLSGRNDCRLSS